MTVRFGTPHFVHKGEGKTSPSTDNKKSITENPKIRIGRKGKYYAENS